MTCDEEVRPSSTHGGLFLALQILRPLHRQSLAISISNASHPRQPSFAHPRPSFIRVNCALQFDLHSSGP